MKFIRVYVGGPRCKIHRRKLTKMYEDANLTTSLSCIYVPVVCILTS